MQLTALQLGAAFTTILLSGVVPASERTPKPLCLDPDNPHYLFFRGKPTVLIGSTEHYGAVMNLDFDGQRYLDTIQNDGMNLTRLFSGAYMEPVGAFNIDRNTLAPAKGRLICPWARSSTPGYANGGNKFDLTQWDGAYFRRLRDYIAQAGTRGIVVEVALFCPYYDDSMWNLAPFNSNNNINGFGDIARTQANSLQNGKLLAVQDAMVRKFTTELKGADNIYYEVCNEPYFGGVTRDWQDHILATLSAAEKELGVHLLYAENVANGSQEIKDPREAISVFNFHYATPPDAVHVNQRIAKVIGDDETGFKGNADATYRGEAWDFLLAGGAIFDNLDYSFAAGHESGDFAYPPTQPGGGSKAFRHQLQILHQFLDSFDLVRMKSDDAVVRGVVPAGATARVLAEPGKAYAIYLRGGTNAELKISIPAGAYRAEWIDTKNGTILGELRFNSDNGMTRVQSPTYHDDIALRIKVESPAH